MSLFTIVLSRCKFCIVTVHFNVELGQKKTNVCKCVCVCECVRTAFLPDLNKCVWNARAPAITRKNIFYSPTLLVFFFFARSYLFFFKDLVKQHQQEKKSQFISQMISLALCVPLPASTSTTPQRPPLTGDKQLNDRVNYRFYFFFSIKFQTG